MSGADRGTVFLIDRKHDELWSLVGLGLEEHEIRMSINLGIVGWVARNGMPVMVDDAHADPRFDPASDRDLGYHTSGLLALPIRNKAGESVGVLELLNKKTGPFTRADENLLSYFAEHVAVALQNARCHREILAKQRMESDLVLARSVQQGLLPDEPPQLEGFDIGVAYTPSLMVGGDYYDFVRLAPESLLTIVADVEGHGVASALLMANIQVALHTLASHVHALENIVKSINNMILSAARTQKLLSMFIAVLDQRRRSLHYINAGHVPPIVIRADGKTLELSEGGTLVGVLPDASYQRGCVEFSSGDIVVAYTDGITEATDAHDNEYGVARLLDVVRTV